MIKKDEIRKLINEGFDLELISFELDIPMKNLVELQNQQMPEYKNIESNNTNQQLLLKLNQMKQKYRSIFFKNTNSNNSTLSPEDIELVNSKIEIIKSNIEALKEKAQEDKPKDISNIFKLVKELDKYQLNVEQCEALNSLLNCQEFDNAVISSSSFANRFYAYLNTLKSSINNKLIKAVEISTDTTNDIDTLKNFKRKLSMVSNGSYTAVSSLKNKIESKIVKLNQLQPSSKNKYGFSENIEKILLDLSSGELDIQNAKETISDEAKKRAESKTQKIFSLTQEQEEKRILFQIRTAIKEDIDEYNICNPELLMSQIQDLCNTSPEEAFATVVEGLINRKNLKMATTLCDKFSFDDVNNYSSSIKNLKIKIKSAEISNIALQLLTKDETTEDQLSNLALLERGISSKKIDLRNINLGKSQDGLRNITLADIWQTELQNQL